MRPKQFNGFIGGLVGRHVFMKYLLFGVAFLLKSLILSDKRDAPVRFRAVRGIAAYHTA